MERFYYSRFGTDVQGPITDEDLWKMVQAGILPPSVQVCREGSEEWTQVVIPSASGEANATPASSRASHEPSLDLQVVHEGGSEAAANSEKADRVVAVIRNYSWGAMAAMVAIPVPGADLGATAAVWGKMIHEIARVYGYEISMEDAKSLGSDLFKSVILTTAAWFASAKTASFAIKFIPFAGTATAFVIDSVVAGFGAKNITARLGTAAALFYQSGKTIGPQTMAEHVRHVMADPNTIRSALGIIAVEAADDLPSHHHHHQHDT